jgi:MFS family permease
MGGLTGSPSFNAEFDDPRGQDLSTIVAIYEIGCFFGAVGAFTFGEKLGRKRGISVGAILMMIGAALQASAFSRGHLIAGRIVSGLGMGMINSTAPVLQAEVSPKASRGRCEYSTESTGLNPLSAQQARPRLLTLPPTVTDVCAQLSTLNAGIFLAYWLDYVRFPCQ